MTTFPNPHETPTLSVGEVAKLLGFGRVSAYNAVNAGEIPSIRVGKRILVPTAALLKMLGAGEGQPMAGPKMMLTIERDIREEISRGKAKYPGAGVASTKWTDAERYVILGEECGEVADEVSKTLGIPGERTANLRAELVQVAAVARQWIQRIDLDEAGIDE